MNEQRINLRTIENNFENLLAQHSAILIESRDWICKN